MFYILKSKIRSFCLLAYLYGLSGYETMLKGFVYIKGTLFLNKPTKDIYRKTFWQSDRDPRLDGLNRKDSLGIGLCIIAMDHYAVDMDMDDEVHKYLLCVMGGKELVNPTEKEKFIMERFNEYFDNGKLYLDTDKQKEQALEFFKQLHDDIKLNFS